MNIELLAAILFFIRTKIESNSGIKTILSISVQLMLKNKENKIHLKNVTLKCIETLCEYGMTR